MCIDDKGRLFAEIAKQKQKKNLTNTVFYFNRYIGLKPNWDIYNLEKNYIPNLIEIENVKDENSIYFKFLYKNENLFLSPESILCSYINKIKQVIKQKTEIFSITFAIPDYFTIHEIESLSNTIKIGDIVESCNFIRESSAITLYYGLNKKDTMLDKDQVVLFVDIGHSKCSLTISQFSKNGLFVRECLSERFCGTRDIDLLLLKFIAEIIYNKHKIDIFNNKKTLIEVNEFVIKARKALSSAKTADLIIDYLTDDISFDYSLTREQFEKIASPVFEKLNNLIFNAFSYLNNSSKYKIYHIYLYIFLYY